MFFETHHAPDGFWVFIYGVMPLLMNPTAWQTSHASLWRDMDVLWSYFFFLSERSLFDVLVYKWSISEVPFLLESSLSWCQELHSWNLLVSDRQWWALPVFRCQQFLVSDLLPKCIKGWCVTAATPLIFLSDRAYPLQFSVSRVSTIFGPSSEQGNILHPMKSPCRRGLGSALPEGCETGRRRGVETYRSDLECAIAVVAAVVCGAGKQERVTDCSRSRRDGLSEMMKLAC